MTLRIQPLEIQPLEIQTEAIQPALGQPQRVPTDPSRKTASPNTLKPALARLRRDESAQDMIEYGLLGAVLALGAVSGINNVADKVSKAFGRIDNRIARATEDDGGHGHGGWGGWH